MSSTSRAPTRSTRRCGDSSRSLNFLDSAGLGRVLALQRRATRDGRRLVVVRGSRAVERLFALTALDLRVEMVSDPSAALQPSTA